MNRQETVRYNASLRIKGRASECLPLPPLPAKIYGWELNQRGTYMGFTMDENEKNEYLQNHPLATAKKVQKLGGS